MVIQNFDEVVKIVRGFYDKYTPSNDLSEYWIQAAPELVSYSLPLGFVLLYLVMLRYFPKVQAKYRFLLRTPKLMKAVFATWNMLLSVYSLFAFVFFSTEMYIAVKEEMYDRDDNPLAVLLCPTSNRYHEGPSAFWMYTFAISKYIELVDTFLLIVKKPQRELKFLHTYHHLTVMILAWVGVRNAFSAGIFGAWMNTFVHTVMYFYYFCTEFFKPPGSFLLTILQITQMLTACCFSLYWIYVSSYRDCHSLNGTFVLCLILIIYSSYLYLFCDFFIKKYIKGVDFSKIKRKGFEEEKKEEGREAEKPKKL